jgi:hypothetical protein
MAEFEQLPYGTFGMFDGCVDRFKESVVPTTLNRHVLHDLSGADYSALGTTLQFFGLTDSERRVKPTFKELVDAKKAGAESYKTALRKLIDDHYNPTILKVDVERGTLPDLEKAFKDSGAKPGQMLTKALRFYIKALEDGCGVKVSEHITKQRRGSKPRNAKPSQKLNGKSAKGGGADDPTQLTPPPLTRNEAPEGFSRIPIPGVEQGHIQYPVGLTEAQFLMYEAGVAFLKSYVQVSNAKGKT